MRARFKFRSKIPLLPEIDNWATMWNCISKEEAKIANHIWTYLNEGDQEALRISQAGSDLLQILVDSRDKREWTQNPVLPMLKYAHVIQLLQPPNWAMCFVMIQNWISEFRLRELESQPPDSEVRAQLQAVKEEIEEARIRWRAVQH
jgi:hypothetical protein